MPGELIFRPVVKDEVEDIVSYYEVRKGGLGLLFLEVLDLLVQRIQSNPLQFQVRHRSIRKASLQKFPYNVYFRIHKSRIVILAVLHQRRNPRIWKRRK